MKTNTKNALKKSIFIAFLLILITVVFSIVVKYDVEGEATLPYSLEKILIVSKVSTSNNEDPANLWNISLEEDNDVYLYINKTDEESDNTIKSISLENFTVTKKSKIGEPIIYRPTGDLNNLYDLSEQNYLGSSITYKGAKADTLKTLEVRNEGGTIGFRASLENLGNYISNNYDEEIVYDGLTEQQLIDKINKFLSSSLKNKGELYVTYSLEKGVDPYLAVAISMHETGCKWNCSTLVKECNNVGGQVGGPLCNGGSYKKYDTLDEGIKGFIDNIAKNYVQKGLTTAEEMNSKYAADTSWAKKVNKYIDEIKES